MWSTVMIAEPIDRRLQEAKDMDHQFIVRNPGILIADDVEMILDLLMFELEPRGFNVFLAVDGNDALTMYQQHQNEIDLVLLDVQMPGMDGPRTLTHLQRLNREVVVCFMTGHAGNYTEEGLLQLGARCVFRKPFQPAEVGESLQKLASAPDSTPFVCDWQVH
jgi:CheY-like chemotaxis protein